MRRGKRPIQPSHDVISLFLSIKYETRNQKNQINHQSLTHNFKFTKTRSSLTASTSLASTKHFPRIIQLETKRMASSASISVSSSETDITLYLSKGKSVEIVNLTSKEGKEINGHLAIVDGKVGTNGRYPVKIHHITGEVERMGIKAQNLNPFLKKEQEFDELNRLKFINYSSDAKIREGHGRLLDQVLMLLRFAINELNGSSFFKGDFQSFMNLSRSDPRIAAANAQVFTMYRVKPSSENYKTPPDDDCSLLDKTIKSLVIYEQQSIAVFGKKAKYNKDGPGGKLVARNMARFMQTWDEERIHGEFWISKITRTGTLVVQRIEQEDGTEELGKVYLVKGIGSQVGEQVPASALPILIRTTFLPMYDFLVYDGVLVASQVGTSQAMRKNIQTHVKRAVREKNVVYCGESARRGLWNTEPPKLSEYANNAGGGDSKIDELESMNGDDKDKYDATPSQLKLATKLVRFAKSVGFKAGDADSILLVRRLAYRKQENPNQLVGLSFPQDASPSHVFPFQKWPTYSLDELLPEIFQLVKRVKSVPCLIWLDEKSLVRPLRDLLEKACGRIGFPEIVEVKWYPPPSEEEQTFHKMMS